MCTQNLTTFHNFELFIETWLHSLHSSMKLLLLVQSTMRNSMQFAELAYTEGKISEEM